MYTVCDCIHIYIYTHRYAIICIYIYVYIYVGTHTHVSIAHSTCLYELVRNHAVGIQEKRQRFCNKSLNCFGK